MKRSKFRDLEVIRGPLGASCACPFEGCKFFAAKRKTEPPRSGFATTSHLRKKVWDHIQQTHDVAGENQ